jgi:hypothetical protein
MFDQIDTNNFKRNEQKERACFEKKIDYMIQIIVMNNRNIAVTIACRYTHDHSRNTDMIQMEFLGICSASWRNIYLTGGTVALWFLRSEAPLTMRRTESLNFSFK